MRIFKKMILLILSAVYLIFLKSRNTRR